MQAQVNILRSQLSDSEEALEKTQEQLELAENRLERARNLAQQSPTPMRSESEPQAESNANEEGTVVSGCHWYAH